MEKQPQNLDRIELGTNPDHTGSPRIAKPYRDRPGPDSTRRRGVAAFLNPQ